MVSLVLETVGAIFPLLLVLWAGSEFMVLRCKRKRQREIWKATMNLPLDLRESGLRHINESGMIEGFTVSKSEVGRQIERVKREKAEAAETPDDQVANKRRTC